jgi:hypothetical protein
VSPRFVIEIDWETLDAGAPEERAAFGALGIRVDGAWLTEAHDASVNRVRQKVHLSGYRLAQWLAWNWWRLRWEPERRPGTVNWAMAHRLTTIGGGYVWPNVECISDGERTTLRAHPTRPRATESLRYVAELDETVSASDFESGVELFVGQTLEQLRAEGIRDSALERIWADVQTERADDDSNWYRRLEAAMGFDPDEADEEVVNALISDGDTLGHDASAELAANASPGRPAPRASDLQTLASSSGHDVDLASIAQLSSRTFGEVGAPWVLGEACARDLRSQERLGDGHLSDKRLAELAGAEPGVLESTKRDTPFSFILGGGGSTARIVLQSPYPTSRRFALARLIGDRVAGQTREPLTPALGSHTYRQKFQRAFAAELLCPFDQARQLFDEDLSDESQDRVADTYQVSPRVVRTQLVNKGLLRRDTLQTF